MKPSAQRGTVLGETGHEKRIVSSGRRQTRQSRTHADTVGSVDVMSGLEQAQWGRNGAWKAV